MNRSQLQGLVLGARHLDLGHRLAERDRGGLHDAVALLADRQRALAQERLLDRLQLVALAAVEAARVGRVAVQLDDLRLRHARALVQAVDVLGDDRRHLALLDQPGERAMAGIGFGLEHGLVGRELAPPRFAPHLLRRHEVVEVDRLVLGPDAARRAEVRDAQFGRDARAGEGDDALGAVDHLAQPVDLAHGPCSLPRRPDRSRA